MIILKAQNMANLISDFRERYSKKEQEDSDEDEDDE